MDVRPVIGNLTQLMNVNSCNTRLISACLRLLVRIVLNPEAISNYFARTLHNLLFDQVEESLDSGKCFNIADVLITKAFDHAAVFKKFFVNDLLSLVLSLCIFCFD